jgi:hypothetical protein
MRRARWSTRTSSRSSGSSRRAADAGDSACEQPGGAAHDVALEVAVQAAGGRSPGQLVVWKREVIDADGDVAGRDQPSGRLGEQLGPQRRVRHGAAALDQLLVRAERREVGIAEQFHPPRRQGDHLIQRRGERVRCLPGQPVDQVDVDALDAAAAELVEKASGLLGGASRPRCSRSTSTGWSRTARAGRAISAHPARRWPARAGRRWRRSRSRSGSRVGSWCISARSRRSGRGRPAPASRSSRQVARRA